MTTTMATAIPMTVNDCDPVVLRWSVEPLLADGDAVLTPSDCVRDRRTSTVAEGVTGSDGACDAITSGDGKGVVAAGFVKGAVSCVSES
jgi:hypothetical protein